MRVGLEFLRERLKRLPPRGMAEALNALEELEAWWSDRCCDGAADPTQHPLVSIFEGSRIWRGPYKDCFHRLNGINKTGDSGVPLQKSELGNDMFRALREIPETETEPVVRWLTRDGKMDRLTAMTKARADYRKHGIIRNRSYSSQRQLQRWRAMMKRWQERAVQCKRDGVPCVIRPQISRPGCKLQGTIEAIQCAEECIAKGCDMDPWPMEQMYIETRLQPKTKLQERLHIGDSGRNEVRHRVFNEICEHVTRVGEDLMEADLDFAIFFTNRSYDVLFGRVDAHSLSCFPWSDPYLNGAAATLSGPAPFPAAASPRNALPPLEPIDESHPHYEPLGFRYLHYLKNTKDDAVVRAALAEGDRAAQEEEELQPLEGESEEDEVDEAQLDSPISRAVRTEGQTAARPRRPATTAQLVALADDLSADASAAATPARSGGRFSRQPKARTETPHNSAPIEPSTPTERQVMVEALTKAMREHRGATSMMYDRAAEFYLARSTIMLMSTTSAAPSDLRPRTSGTLLKAAAERCMRFQARVALERSLSTERSEAVSRALDAAGEQEGASGSASADAEEEPQAGAISTLIAAAQQMESSPPAAPLLLLPEPSQSTVAMSSSKRKVSEAETKHSKHNKKAREERKLVHRSDLEVAGRVTSRVIKRIARREELTKMVSVDSRFSSEQIRLNVLEQWPQHLTSITLPGTEA